MATTSQPPYGPDRVNVSRSADSTHLGEDCSTRTDLRTEAGVERLRWRWVRQQGDLSGTQNVSPAAYPRALPHTCRCSTGPASTLPAQESRLCVTRRHVSTVAAAGAALG